MTYNIFNQTSGLFLGAYTAESPEAAIAAMYRDAGYADEKAAAAALEIPAENLADDLRVEEAGDDEGMTSGWIW